MSEIDPIYYIITVLKTARCVMSNMKVKSQYHGTCEESCSKESSSIQFVKARRMDPAQYTTHVDGRAAEFAHRHGSEIDSYGPTLKNKARFSFKSSHTSAQLRSSNV